MRAWLHMYSTVFVFLCFCGTKHACAHMNTRISICFSVCTQLLRQHTWCIGCNVCETYWKTPTGFNIMNWMTLISLHSTLQVATNLTCLYLKLYSCDLRAISAAIESGLHSGSCAVAFSMYKRHSLEIQYWESNWSPLKQSSAHYPGALRCGNVNRATLLLP